jgi:hypothetical protein
MQVHGIFSCGMSPVDAKPYGYALDVAAFFDDWRISFLNGATLREHAAMKGSGVAIR